MSQNFDFFKTTMPKSRLADFYLGYLKGSVFIDFNLIDEQLIYLMRISFDGYGCCNLRPEITPLSIQDSKAFLEAV